MSETFMSCHITRYSQLTEDEIFKLNEFVIHTVKQIDKDNFIIVSDCIHGPTTLSAEYGIKHLIMVQTCLLQ